MVEEEGNKENDEEKKPERVKLIRAGYHSYHVIRRASISDGS
jgi:hypothetical protein